MKFSGIMFVLLMAAASFPWLTNRDAESPVELSGRVGSTTITPVIGNPDRLLTVTVSVSSTDNSTTKSTDFTVTISGLPSDVKWRDLHLISARSKKFPRLLSSTAGTTVSPSPSGDNQIWKVKTVDGRDQLNVYSGTGSSDPQGFGNGTFTFNVAWNIDDYNAAKGNPVTWSATKDGDQYAGTTDTIFKSEDSEDPSPKVRQLTCSLNYERDEVLPLNATTAFIGSVSSGFAGLDYQIYSSTKLVTDYSDTLGIGIDTQGFPIPTSWGLTFSNFTGTVASGGAVMPSPSITVPNTANLVGNVFYLVLAVKQDGAVVISSTPLKLTVTE
jgi:hypothetical protein